MKIKGRFLLDKNEKLFIKHNKKIWGNEEIRSDRIVLVDLFSMNHSIIIYSYLANVLSEMKGAYICSFYQAITLRQKISNFLSLSIVKKLYISFSCKKNIRVTVAGMGKHQINQKINEIISNFKCKSDVVKLEIDGIKIGDLIYDSYLRDYGCPTINLEKSRIKKILKQGLVTYYFWKQFLEKNNVVSTIISHEVYIQYGILSRLCNEKGINVYLTNRNFLKSLTKEKCMEASDFENYKKVFLRLSKDVKKKSLSIAKEHIERRLSGEVGVDMEYQEQSAYHSIKKERLLSKSSNIKVLIATHCFFDNPHSYEWMLFPDFYEWLCFLGKMSEKTDYDWYLKTHPDYRTGTKEVINKIINKYPKIIFLPADSSHHQLIEEGINIVLTVHGSIGHEYAYFGIPVINAGQNPHIAFNFNIHTKTLSEYENIIMNLNNLTINIDKEEIYMFYYVHYFIYSYDTWFYSNEFKDKFVSIEQFHTSLVLKKFIKEYYKENHEKLVNRMKTFIQSKEYQLITSE